MGWTGLDLNSVLEKGKLYRARMTFQGKDVAVVGERCGLYCSRWNSIYKYRFDATKCYVAEGLINLEGYGVAPETAEHLNFTNFWGSHLHVEGIHWYDLSFDDNGCSTPPAELPPGAPGGGATPSPPATGPVTGQPGAPPTTTVPGKSSPLTIILVAVAVVGLLIAGVILLGGHHIKGDCPGGKPCPA
jgi:hypothetical protein